MLMQHNLQLNMWVMVITEVAIYIEVFSGMFSTLWRAHKFSQSVHKSVCVEKLKNC
jgi:hypothetical protein